MRLLQSIILVGITLLGTSMALSVLLTSGKSSSTAQPRMELQAQNMIFFITFSPDGKLLASLGLDGVIELWDLRQKRLLCSIQSVVDLVNPGFSPDSRYLAFVDQDRFLKLWDVAESRVAFTVPESKGTIALSFSLKQSLLAFATSTDSLRVWNLAAQTVDKAYEEDVWHNSVVMGPLGRRLFFICSDGKLKICNLHSHKPVTIGVEKLEPTSAPEFCSNGKLLAFGRRDKSILVWHVGKRRYQFLRSPNLKQARSLSFTPNGTRLISVQDDKQLLVWDVETGKVCRSLRRGVFRMFCVAISPQGNVLASGDSGGKIALWDLPSGVWKGR